MSEQRDNSFALAVLRVLGISLVLGLFGALAFHGLGDTKPSAHVPAEFHFKENPNADFTIENGIEVESGLIAKGDWFLVKQNCTVCHSSKLITQNRADAKGWKKMIEWMQETQGLWQLGANEPKIVNYLASYYKPEKTGRRKALEIEEWYVIE